MPRLSDWASGNPYGFRRPKQEIPMDNHEVRGLYFRNVDGQMRVLFANETTGEVIEADDNMITFIVINSEAAEVLRDELLVPSIFPDAV